MVAGAGKGCVVSLLALEENKNSNAWNCFIVKLVGGRPSISGSRCFQFSSSKHLI
jgi:hypothetical protein